MQKKLWAELGTPSLDADLQMRVSEAVERSYGDRPVRALVRQRDERLRRLLIAKSLETET